MAKNVKIVAFLVKNYIDENMFESAELVSNKFNEFWCRISNFYSLQGLFKPTGKAMYKMTEMI